MPTTQKAKVHLIPELVSQGLNALQILDSLTISQGTLRKWMKEFGIKTPKGFWSTGAKPGRKPGFKHTQEFKDLLREKFSGEQNPFYGKQHDSETKEKMSRNHADFSGDNNPFKKSLQEEGKLEEHRLRCTELWDKRDEQWRRAFSKKLQKGFGEIDGTFWARVRSNARVRGIAVELSPEDCWNIFEEQERRCALTGLELKFEGDTTASLDRKNSQQSYNPNNVQWLHKRINVMKGDMTDDDFISWCRKVVDYAEARASNRQPTDGVPSTVQDCSRN